MVHFVRTVFRLGARGLTVVAVAILFAVGIGPRLAPYRTVTVLSGSMRPTFAPGDVLVVTPERARDVRVGDVITYSIPVADHHVESHRVIKVVRGGDRPVVVTKGDANSAADPWQAQLGGGTVWRYRGRVPLLGHAILTLRQPLVRRASVLVAPLLLVVMALVRIWQLEPKRRKLEGNPREARA